MNRKGIMASSATYRKAVNKISEVLNVDPEHSKHPSEDFEDAIELIDEKSRERALKFYRMGLRRGFEEACDSVLKGEIKLENKELICPEEISICVGIKFKNQPRIKRKFNFSASELGFE